GILMLVMLFQNISRGMASWKRVRQILDADQMQDGEFEKSTPIKGDIEFRNASFGYPGSDKRVLEGVNLHIHPGETVAIMGTTGCGKSTLISLIPRFYDASEGEVLVDGVDVREYRQRALRDRIAIAMQKSELFSVSIAENILWGDPEASGERIEKAASVAQADCFIREMEAGYGSIVAERGMSLSGGQKQRVSLARAVIKDAEILILDDATSALDLKTEAELYKALDASKPDCTKIIVAQRIASARRADRIVILDNGRIAASGSHEELLCTCPLYKEIARSQMGEEALA
ncbi:MAG: ABC transporter ATP-binding protein, partial [Candidatus Ornithospirochaeta sp.]|nr:ABC transporter ATP-binding protein [Candidatus Ornithospirochaeta sp.]